MITRPVSVRSRTRRSPLAALAVVCAVSCGGNAGLPSDTYPSGWADARTLALQQSTCGADPLTAPPSPGLQLRDAGGTLVGVYTDAEFRCGEQQVCGYVQDVGETTRVLIQPCDLRPTQVARCDCLYQITFKLPARADRTAVELYHRWDLYGSSAAVPATLVDTRSVGGGGLNWYRTCGQPVCPADDGGTTLPDGGAAVPCTTQRAGDICAPTGTSCDPGVGCGVLLLCSDRDPRAQRGGCPN